MTDNSNQEDNKLQNFPSEIIKELCNLSIPNKKESNTNNFINWCLNDEINPTIQIILANCYRFGKWIEKDDNKAFIYYQKSADIEYDEGIFGVGFCYEKGIGVEKDEHKAFSYYQKSADE
ncbi:hypothetical protein C2G38_2151872 [Gigaspora rosea]|uniref:HCP-like protein n=1 Tax=Gigaspora rosea TaxID=44941 RepID=A0A397WAS9_9GLOM|nr:hypothetical protein C2G38_2234566 [Gigaspora rosea]RIB30739.1 hypothetical protein C2G38_2151872 [Gigaspora rosea]